MDTPNPRSIPHHLQSLWRSIAPQGRFAIFCLVTVESFWRLSIAPGAASSASILPRGRDGPGRGTWGVHLQIPGNPLRIRAFYPPMPTLKTPAGPTPIGKKSTLIPSMCPTRRPCCGCSTAPMVKAKTTSEYQGYGMLYAAHLEDDDAVLEKLWNFAEYHFNEKGLMKVVHSTDGTAEAPSSCSGW